MRTIILTLAFTMKLTSTFAATPESPIADMPYNPLTAMSWSDRLIGEPETTSTTFKLSAPTLAAYQVGPLINDPRTDLLSHYFGNYKITPDTTVATESLTPLVRHEGKDRTYIRCATYATKTTESPIISQGDAFYLIANPEFAEISFVKEGDAIPRKATLARFRLRNDRHTGNKPQAIMIECYRQSDLSQQSIATLQEFMRGYFEITIPN